MKNNPFFKPTPLYREFMILDLIEKNKNITQREISEMVDVSVSLVNYYIDTYQKLGYIKKQYHSTKTVEYFILKKGKERKNLLNIQYLKAAYEVHLFAKQNLVDFLMKIVNKGYKKILLYGAGDVADIILKSLINDYCVPIEVVAVVDDDLSRKGEYIVNIPIISKEDIVNYQHDCIFISSYKHQEAIINHLKSINYSIDKVINFFDN